MSIAELVAALLGVANIVLLIRRSVWNYPFGIAMVALYAWVFFQARLYSDAGLQIFLAIQFYGWWKWLRATDAAGAVPVGRLRPRACVIWAAVTAVAALADGLFLARFTADVAPALDALTTAMSVTAQILLSLRRIENWVLWIAVDCVGVGLYYWKGLFATTALYALFLVLAVVGLVAWRHEMVRAA